MELTPRNMCVRERERERERERDERENEKRKGKRERRFPDISREDRDARAQPAQRQVKCC